MGLPVDKGKLLADRLKKIQNEIIRLMTTIPKETIEKIPMLEKAKLFEAVQEKYEATDDAAAGSEESGDVPAAPVAVAESDL